MFKNNLNKNIEFQNPKKIQHESIQVLKLGVCREASS